MSNNREVPPGPRVGDPPTQMKGPEWDQLALTKRVAELEGQVAACVAALEKISSPSSGCAAENYSARQLAHSVLASLAHAAEAYERRITEPLRARVEQLETALRDIRSEVATNYPCNHPADDGGEDCADEEDRVRHWAFAVIDAALTIPAADWMADDELLEAYKAPLTSLEDASSIRYWQRQAIRQVERVREKQEECDSLRGQLAAAKAEGAREALEKAADHFPEWTPASIDDSLTSCWLQKDVQQWLREWAEREAEAARKGQG